MCWRGCGALVGMLLLPPPPLPLPLLLSLHRLWHGGRDITATPDQQSHMPRRL
jgi:hypothetical protein